MKKFILTVALLASVSAFATTANANHNRHPYGWTTTANQYHNSHRSQRRVYRQERYAQPRRERHRYIPHIRRPAPQHRHKRQQDGFRFGNIIILFGF